MGDMPYDGYYAARSVRPIRIVDRSRFIQYHPQRRPHSMDMVVVPAKTLSRNADTTMQRKGTLSETPLFATAHPVNANSQQKRNHKTIHKQFAASITNSQSEKPKSVRKYYRIRLILVSMAFLVFGLGLLVNLQTLQTNHSAQAQVAALSQKTASNPENNATLPTETKPNDSIVKAYAVAPNLPKYLKIPVLGINARVLQTGITVSGALGAPPNIHDVAWYTGSAHPGDSGSIGAELIDGHVHGPTLPGVFVNLKKLVSGDTIQIIRGDNQVFTYKVVRVQNFGANTMNMGMMLASVQPGEPGLNLITCGGPFDHNTSEYTQRTAVFAVQI